MLAYHNDPAVKAKYLARVIAHRDADALIKGTGWEDGKGCAIGCTLEAYEHARYPVELGIPEMLAHLEDRIFEGLPNERAQQWPEQFLAAIEPGADLSRVGWQFLLWLITRSGIGAYDHPLVRDAVTQVANVLREPADGRPVDQSAASAAWSAAWSAASAASAESAAWSAAWSAASAAWSAASAESAASAASAESAAWSAARSAARSAERSAESAAYTTMADQLLDLLRAAKPDSRL